MDTDNIKKELIAPCGMNCGVCSGYLAYSHKIPKKKGNISHCSGCRPRNKQCSFIKKRCEIIKNNEVDFCYQCKEFPCTILVLIVKGYVKRYHYNVIENGMFIKEHGLEKFILKEVNIYKCTHCGDTICIHNKKCYACDKLDLL